jgi:hypothetical protein
VRYLEDYAEREWEVIDNGYIYEATYQRVNADEQEPSACFYRSPEYPSTA